jgi:hypothetical protein
MKKRKPPKLVVDNKLPDESTEEFSYEEFRVIADNLLEVHARYPEIDALTKRARANNDYAMVMASWGITGLYDLYRDIAAAREREKLHVVAKGKRDP